MADSISHTWQTVEQAAVMTGVSTRTIARRISNGTMESRVDDNGRRLVLIQSFGHVAASDDKVQVDVAHAMGDFTNNEQEVTVKSASTALSYEASDRAVASANSVLAVLQTTIDAARTDAKRARTGANWAWAGVGVLTLLVVVGGLCMTNVTTQATTRAGLLEQQVSQVKVELGKTQNDLIVAHSAKSLAEAQAVREASEKQQAQQAYASLERERSKIVSVTQRPTTQPTRLNNPWASIFGE